MSYVISRQLIREVGLSQKEYLSRFGWNHEKYVARHYDCRGDALDVISAISHDAAKNYVFDIEKDLQYA